MTTDSSKLTCFYATGSYVGQESLSILSKDHRDCLASVQGGTE